MAFPQAVCSCRIRVIRPIHVIRLTDSAETLAELRAETLAELRAETLVNRVSCSIHEVVGRF